jgi:major membrane immunogen (membrane-anchored lipoprotein)
MKKIFLAAVIGASFLFTACGDDSSSSPNTEPGDTQDVEKKDGDNPSKDNGTVVPEPNGKYQGCWYTSDATSVTEYEVTAVGKITRIWTIEDGKVMKSTDYNDGTEPMIDEEYSMSSLNDAIEMEKGVCKKM